MLEVIGANDLIKKCHNDQHDYQHAQLSKTIFKDVTSADRN